jgi:3-oxosteroid 1-dehydrogenase
MVDFLVSQGLKLRRVPIWPDYYDFQGCSTAGRTVVAELFDANLLGEWRSKLRPNFLPLPANLEEAMLLPHMSRMGAARMALAKIMWRLIISKLRGKRLVAAGAALQGQMLYQALKAGVDIRVNAGVKQLICDGERVTGVVTQQDRKIGARLGVLINAGGFARNQRMLDKYISGTSTAWTNVAPGDTGEMIEEAVRIGAAVAQMDERIGSPMALPPGAAGLLPGMQGDVSKPHAIVVDQSGLRYMCEAGSYVDFCVSMIERHKHTPAVPSWLVMDSQYVAKYMLAGTMPGLKSKPKAWFEQGFLRQGNTLAELAAACGLDPATLTATVERFNGYVAQGRDDDFQRGARTYDQWLGDPLHAPSKSLGTLEKGPFYALQVYPGDVSTWGGVVTDAQARVLRADGSCISGLYATGTSAATVMANRTAGAGTSVGPAFTWGYVAALHALGAENLVSAK